MCIRDRISFRGFMSSSMIMHVLSIMPHSMYNVQVHFWFFWNFELYLCGNHICICELAGFNILQDSAHAIWTILLCNWCIFLWYPISYLWNWWIHQTAEYSLAKTMNLGASPLAGNSSCCSPLPNFQESHTYFEQYLQWVRVSKGFKVGDVGCLQAW